MRCTHRRGRGFAARWIAYEEEEVWECHSDPGMPLLPNAFYREVLCDEQICRGSETVVDELASDKWRSFVRRLGPCDEHILMTLSANVGWELAFPSENIGQARR